MGSLSRASTSGLEVSCASGLEAAARRLRTATSAMSASVMVPASRQARAWSAAMATESGHSGPR